MIRVADYIARGLADRDVTDVFLVTGGGAMHLNDAIGRERRLRWWPCHHEQTCAIAAESYFRSTNRLAAVNVTTGPGGTNALGGVWGAYVDSCGMVVISGQVKWETLVRSTPLPLRQLGDQEVDIVRLASSVTKYAVQVTQPRTVRYHLERAIHLARTGRPGPTWLDIPMNVQSALIDPAGLEPYDPTEDRAQIPARPPRSVIEEVVHRLSCAERPVIYAGAGVRLAGAAQLLVALAHQTGIPVVTAFNAHDLIPDDDPCLAGRPGTIGDRAGNFAVQNADVVLVIGCRLNIRQISYNWKSFARAAFKIMVDVDAAELHKPTLTIDLPIHADAKDVLSEVLEALQGQPPAEKHLRWRAWCTERRRRYPVVLPHYGEKPGPVNPYSFVDELSSALPAEAVVVTGDGTACIATFQALRLRAGQRLYSNSGAASMGWDVPAAIGAAIANPGRTVVCIAGDGSLMMNIQDLATIERHQLAVKVVLLNNGGYQSIRLTQNSFFPDNPVGFDVSSGVGFPEWEKLASAFRLPFVRATNLHELKHSLGAFLSAPGAGFMEVVVDPEQPFAPKLSSRRLDDGRMVTSPLEDMAPFLSRDELRENMLVPPDEP